MLCCVWQPVPQHPPTVPCAELDADGHAQPPVFGAAALQSTKPAPHVYVHAVPLQPTAVAFVPLQALPQAAQFWIVFSVVHVVPPQRVSRQVHEPFLQSGLGCVQVAWFVHVPEALHVCGVLPLQLVCPGAHEPEHTPATQVVFVLVQLAGLPHVPLAVHE